MRARGRARRLIAVRWLGIPARPAFFVVPRIHPQMRIFDPAVVPHPTSHAARRLLYVVEQ